MSEQLEFGEEDRSAVLPRVWQLCLALLASKVSKMTYSFAETVQPISYQGSTIALGVPSPFAREWLEKKAANAIRSALEFHLDATGLEIKFVVLSRDQKRSSVSPDNASPAKKTENPSARTTPPTQTTLEFDAVAETDNLSAPEQRETRKDSKEDFKKEASKADFKEDSAAPTRSQRPVVPTRSSARKSDSRPAANTPVPIPSLPLNERYIFDTYLTGRSNRMAHACASKVAAEPGEVYNPLFLYGGPGLGKTHLMHGIAHSMRQLHPQLRIAYVSGEYFAQHYITSIREHATEDFRRQYREVDVWLMDDVQFIASKEHCKEEFFHTFNTLYQTGRQIVIASDRGPRELNTMDERLTSRFQSGLIVEVGPPDLETRIAILQQCRQRENASVSDEVLEYIGSAIQSNIRALEGALTRLIAHSSIMHMPATPELAQSVLSDYFIDKPIRYRKITVDEIVDEVAVQFGVSSAAIKGPNRNKDLSLARQVAMYVCRELLPELNTTVTGAAFGGRDHATIVYACQRAKALMEVDHELKTLVDTLMKKLLR